jgi:hypothetical protein
VTEDERLARLLRRGFPPLPAQQLARDLWPAVAERMNARARWSGFDIGVAVAVAITVVLSPDTLWLIAYHL